MVADSIDQVAKCPELADDADRIMRQFKAKGVIILMAIDDGTPLAAHGVTAEHPKCMLCQGIHQIMGLVLEG